MSQPRDETAPERPVPDGFASWPSYWTAQGMPWRTEPALDQERQQFLAERRVVASDIERGIYPFRDERGSIELTRADVEWLLATHESSGMRGPVDWNDAKQRRREGLDLRGADLRGRDLNHLPLARLRGGPTADEWRGVSLQKSQLGTVRLDRADLYGTQLQGAMLREAEMQGTNLWEADLQGVYLRDAQLQGAYLYEARLQGADLRGARLDSATVLTAISLDKETRLADVLWNGAPLQRVRWEQVRTLGDESEARRRREPDDTAKDAGRRLWQFQAAVRAQRQLSTALRDQGLNEQADRFAYRAQVLQREVFRRQGSYGRWAFSWLLAALSGYGYRIWRILVAYVLTLAGFAIAFYLAGLFSAPHLTPYEAAIVSFTAIHGRVFLGQFGLDSTLSLIAGIEAVFGIVIEGVFVAMLVQRFFAR